MSATHDLMTTSCCVAGCVVKNTLIAQIPHTRTAYSPTLLLTPHEPLVLIGSQSEPARASPRYCISSDILRASIHPFQSRAQASNTLPIVDLVTRGAIWSLLIPLSHYTGSKLHSTGKGSRHGLYNLQPPRNTQQPRKNSQRARIP
jgi:hypothetical protein